MTHLQQPLGESSSAGNGDPTRDLAEIRCAHTEIRALETLVENPRNPNKHPPEQLRLLGKVIVAAGWRQAIVVSRRSGFVIKGHGRLQAARMAGLAEAPVDVQDYATEADEWADMAADNRLAELAEMSLPELGALLGELKAAGADMELAGFDAAALSAKTPTKAESEENPTSALTEKWGVTLGQLWRLGRHRVACGDSSDPRTVRRIMNGEHPDVTIVDPPFQCAESVWAKWIQDPCIVFGQAVHLRMIPDKLWRFERVIVKNYSHRSATVQITHGHAFVAQCGTVKTLPADKRLSFPSVIQQEIDTDHDHQKPVALVREHLLNWTPPGRIVVDPFLGSGTSVLACEQSGRDCRGIELNPDYVAVTLERWLHLTGQPPTLVESDNL